MASKLNQKNPGEGIDHRDSLVSEDNYFFIPSDIVAKVERERELTKMRDLKRRSNNPYRYTHKVDDRPFVFWDGEGPRDAGYALFGNSDGLEICKPHLSTQECLELICSAKPGIHCWYGGNYDVSMILHNLSWRQLKRLKTNNVTVYRGYRIEYVPRKWFVVSNGKTRIKIFDVVSFFATNFQTAVSNFRVATESEIRLLTENKARRDKFLWSEIEDIKIYWRLELKLGVKLMDQLRIVFRDAGFNVRSWHGPGALARMALKRHHVELAMAKCPAPVRLAAMFAFAGGRFEMTHGGLINGTIYNADLRSAYPHFARMLPNLARGKWRYTNNYEPGKFAVYHIAYHSEDGTRDRVFPLFRRLETGEVIWPREVEGWYWSPEAELVWNDPDAQIIEGWCFDEEDKNDRPFAWITDYFDKRMVLKKVGNPAEFTFKLIINSVYGQLAQRTGWNKKKRTPPCYHQLEWAGYITSACRAQMYKLATGIHHENLVSIDTDGIYATESLPVRATSGLGGWEVSEYPAGLFWQSGIYSLADESGNWTRGKTKTRGIPKGTYSTEHMLDCLRKGTPLSMVKHVFVGFGLALNGQYDRLNQWYDETHVFDFGGKGKRYHNKYRCPEYCDTGGSGVHTFIQRPVRPGMSYPHQLPWLEPDSQVRLTHSDLVFFDGNDLSEDDEWAWEYRT